MSLYLSDFSFNYCNGINRREAVSFKHLLYNLPLFRNLSRGSTKLSMGSIAESRRRPHTAVSRFNAKQRDAVLRYG